jgi:hypothetical protein
MASTQKGHGGKAHPHPGDGRAQDNERAITGSIHVRGEVETQVPSDLVEEYRTSNHKADSRENKRFALEILTLVLVVAGAAFAFVQMRQAQKSANAAVSQAEISKEELAASERPWVAFEVTDGTIQISDKAATIVSTARVVNSGHSVAKNLAYRPFLAVDERYSGRECESAAKDAQKMAGDAHPGTVVFPNQVARFETPAIVEFDQWN